MVLRTDEKNSKKKLGYKKVKAQEFMDHDNKFGLAATKQRNVRECPTEAQKFTKLIYKTDRERIYHDKQYWIANNRAEKTFSECGTKSSNCYSFLANII